jgi:hypothetical protein
MPTSAIIMLVVTSVVLFGGIGICTYIALRKK